MRFSEKNLQELKNGKIQFDELEDRYLVKELKNKDCEFDYIDQYIELDNILELLSNKVCSFEQLVDKLKSIQDRYEKPSLYCLIRSEELFNELLQHNMLTRKDLRVLFDKIDNTSELFEFDKNVILINALIDNNIVSCRELIDKYLSIKSVFNNGTSCLSKLLFGHDMHFTRWLDTGKLTNEDLKYLVGSIKTVEEGEFLCLTKPLINYLLSNYVFDEADIDKLNKMLSSRVDGHQAYEEAWEYPAYSTQTVFDFVEFWATHHWSPDSTPDYMEICKNADEDFDNETLAITSVSRKLYSFMHSFDLNANQRTELADILKDNEQAQNTLIQIVDNHLEDQYDFEQLKNILTKNNDKTLKIRFNF